MSYVELDRPLPYSGACEILTLDQLGQRFSGAVAAIGNLDGVHLGHKQLVAQAKQLANSLGAPMVVVSFEPHPTRYFNPLATPFRLSMTEPKAALLSELGVQALCVVNFDIETATMNAEDFVERLLVGQGKLRGLVAGPDFRFGQQRKGDLVLASQLGMITRTIPGELDEHGEMISSTRVRERLADGDVPGAQALLGHPHGIWGQVERGDQLGRTIGFPTANLQTWWQMLPQDGIYAAYSHLGDNSRVPTALYVGKRPSVDGLDQRFEAHLLDWQGDLYDQVMSVELVAQTRGDASFDGLDALKAQIERDCAAVKAVLGIA